MDRNRWTCLGWLFAGIWLLSFGWGTLTAGTHSGSPAAGIAFLALVSLVGLHAILQLGIRGAGLFFSVICLTSFTLEALSIASGFPFGFFVHNTNLGPKPFGVPLVVPLGYAVFSWLAWSQARVIATALSDTFGFGRLAVPILGAFILAGYDYSYDAIGATVLKIHSYLHPSGLFGVPASNFLGWLLTGWLAFQIFVSVPMKVTGLASEQKSTLDIIPSLVWGVMGASYWVKYAVAPAGSVAEGERIFLIADIYEAAAAISLPAMVFPAVLALLALHAKTRTCSNRECVQNSI